MIKNILSKTLILLFDIFIIFIIFIIYLDETMPSPKDFFTQKSIHSTIILDRNGEELFRFFKNEDRIYTKINDLPDSLKYAILAAEDRKFYVHSGFSVSAIARCLYFAMKNEIIFGNSGNICGGSTLSQQLIKNTVLKGIIGDKVFDRSIIRKIQEIILSYKLETIYSKDEILEMYINEVPFGGVHYGVESASRSYFDKTISDLTLAESAFLAGMIQAPTVYNPFFGNLKKGKERQAYVFSQLEKGEDLFGIKQGEIDQAKNEKLFFDTEYDSINAPHFVLYVREYLIEKYGISSVEKDGLIVLTSLDKKLQNIVEDNIKGAIPQLKNKFNAYNAGAVLVNSEKGEILAFVGSVDFKSNDPRINGQNYIVSSLRQYAGLMTPYTYATIIEKGYGPWLETADIPNYTFSTGYPNYDKKYFGPMTARQALGQSRNNANIYMADLVKINEVDKMQRLLGIKSNKRWNADNYYSALGLIDTTLMENVQAYSVFANKGQKVDISPILKIYDSQGRLLEDRTRKKGKNIMTKEEAYLVNYALCDLDNHHDRLFDNQYNLNKEQQLCGKTGLSTGPREYSAITYNSNMVLGVWTGNSNNELLKLSYKENPALSISKNTFKQIFTETERKYKKFTRPTEISKTFVCTDTGEQTQKKSNCRAEKTVIRKKSFIKSDSRSSYYMCNANPLYNTFPFELAEAKKYNVVTRKTFINKQLENINQKSSYENYLQKQKYIFQKPLSRKYCDYPLGVKESMEWTVFPKNKIYTKFDKIVIQGVLYNPEKYNHYFIYLLPKNKTNVTGKTLLYETIPSQEQVDFYFALDIPDDVYPGQWELTFVVTSDNQSKRDVYSKEEKIQITIK